MLKTKETLNIDEDNFHLAINGDIHIIPEIVGAKKAGLGKVLSRYCSYWFINCYRWCRSRRMGCWCFNSFINALAM
jgi:predicted phage tail protein